MSPGARRIVTSAIASEPVGWPIGYAAMRSSTVLEQAVLRWASWLHRAGCPAIRTSMSRIIATLIMASDVAVSRS